MFKDSRNEYAVKTAPIDDPEMLEHLLNSMSSEGWELYTLHEAEAKDGGIQYSCIFFRDAEESEEKNTEIVDISDFKSKMEKIFHGANEPFEECKELQRKIKEKQQRVESVKGLLDSNASDIDRQNLNFEISKAINELKSLKQKLIETISPDKMYETIRSEKLSIVISEELVGMVDPENEAPLVSETVKVRKKLTDKYGYVIPSIHFTDSEELEANEYKFNVRGVPTLTGHVYPGCKMFFPKQANIEKKPEGAIEELDSITGEKVFWIDESKTKDFWDKGLSSEEVIAKNLEYIALKYVDEIFDYSDVNKFVEIAGSQNLFLVESIIPDFVSVADLRYILASLIRERVPLNDVVFVFEKLSDLAQDHEKENIIEDLRLCLNRQISKSIANDNRTIYGIKMSTELVKKMEQDLLQETEQITVKAATIKKLTKQIKEAVEQAEVHFENVAIIAPSSIRQMLFVIFEQVIPNISVLAREEISKEFTLDVIGEMTI